MRVLMKGLIHDQPLADLDLIGSLSPPVSSHQRQRLEPHLSSESKPESISQEPEITDWIGITWTCWAVLCAFLFLQILEVFHSANAAKGALAVRCVCFLCSFVFRIVKLQ